jgi:hypothetical protein
MLIELSGRHIGLSHGAAEFNKDYGHSIEMQKSFKKLKKQRFLSLAVS